MGMIFRGKFRLDVEKNFLAIRTIPEWNGMSWEVLGSSSLEVFKQKLNDQVNTHLLNFFYVPALY